MTAPPVTFELDVPFENERLANIAYQSIHVDTEIRPDVVQRDLSVNGNVLHVYVSNKSIDVSFSFIHFNCSRYVTDSAKQLRVCLTGFFDALTLVLQTIKAFPPPLNK